MALQKVKNLPTGFSAEYWTITRLEIDKINKSAIVTLACYKDAATRQANGQPIEQQRFHWSGNDYPFTDPTGCLYSQAYAKIKEVKKVPATIPVAPGATNPAPTIGTQTVSTWFSDAVDC